MATATAPGRRGPGGAEAARRVAQAGRATIRRQNPSSRGRGIEGLCLGAASLHSGHLCGIGPEPGTWKDPDPRRRSSRGSGAQNRPACPAMAATRRLRPVLLNDFLALWSQALAFLAVTHRYKRTHCLWLEQFQIARTISDPCRIFLPGRDSALVSGRAHISQIWITRFLASRH